jgi:hypothetical protein
MAQFQATVAMPFLNGIATCKIRNFHKPIEGFAIDIRSEKTEYLG